LIVGVVSDTHGLLRPEALRALAGVERILHAGDVGDPAVLRGLAAVAPVTAVRGNVDRDPWASGLPPTVEIEIGDVWIHMLHAREDLALVPEAAGFDVVVYGHSHRPSIERRNGVLYLNPGSVGPRRFRLPVTIAYLEIEGGGARARHLPLPCR
jgi:putative phosphoesterase